jgi:integrase
MISTTEILAQQRRTGQHALALSEEGFVSTTSRWAESLWTLDPNTERQRTSIFNFDWTTFPAQLVPEFKVLLWSLLVSRPTSQPLALSGAQAVFFRLRHLARWMHRRNLPRLASLTPAAVEIYVSELKELLKRRVRDRDEELSTSTVATWLRPLQFAFEQRAQLRTAGFKAMKTPPFGEGSPWSEATSVAEKIDSFTPPLPDEIVLPIVSRASFLIRDAAEDVIRLQERMVDIVWDQRLSRRQVERQRFKLLVQHTFAEFGGGPWRGQLGEWQLSPDRPEPSDPTLAFRRLIFDIVAACVLVIRFQTGIRHGEILTWEAGLDENGMPACVTVEDSVSGVYELFFANGVLEKGVDSPTPTRWLLAGRLKGDEQVPDAIRALQVLNRLMNPWRTRSSRTSAGRSLLIKFGTAGFPASADDLAPMTSEHLAELLRRFYAHQVDLTALEADPRLTKYAQHHGRYIQSRQWRKTWANFMFRTNSRLLPAIAQQFQHASTLLTQEAYVGKDPAQLGLVESAAMERASAFMRRVLDGEDGVGGGMRKVVDELHDLKRKAAGVTGADRQEVARTWLTERAIRMWPARHGKCFIGLLPEESRCHQASGTEDWSTQCPNFITRSARLCSGCKCFAIDEEDVPFWLERYFENRRIWDEARARYMEAHYVVAKERFEQSERLLRSVGVHVDELKGVKDAAGHYA